MKKHQSWSKFVQIDDEIAMSAQNIDHVKGVERNDDSDNANTD